MYGKNSKNKLSNKSESDKSDYQPELAWERASSQLSQHLAFAHVTPSSSSTWYPGLKPLLRLSPL